MKTNTILTIISLITLAGVIIFRSTTPSPSSNKNPQATQSPPTPTISESSYETFTTYQKPTLPNKESYTIILVGDSMTAALGENTDMLRATLEKKHPDITFGIFNYSYPSTNINILPKALLSSTSTPTHSYSPILDRQFDILIIESFGYNPLSGKTLEQGLIHQTQILNQAMLDITQSHPNSQVAFLATIAPNDKKYGINTLTLSPQERERWTQERHNYIQNFITYAQKHNIPVINAYEASQLVSTIQGNPEYINPDDNIHPSPQGIKLISNQIESYISRQLPTQ